MAQELELPGTVVLPDENNQGLFSEESPDTSQTSNFLMDAEEHFQKELEPPVQSATKQPAPPAKTVNGQGAVNLDDPAELKKQFEILTKELQARKGMDPLMNLLASDTQEAREIRDFIRSKTAAKQETQPVKLEMPQKPSDFNEAEAYNNDKSASWKYRKDLEAYKEAEMESLRQEIRAEKERNLRQQQVMQQRLAQERQMQEMKKQALELGIQEDEFPEFFNMVNEAEFADTVEYYRYKKAKMASDPRYVPPGKSAPAASQAQVYSKEMRSDSTDISKMLMEAASRL